MLHLRDVKQSGFIVVTVKKALGQLVLAMAVPCLAAAVVRLHVLLMEGSEENAS